jgi:hypothetical protein
VDGYRIELRDAIEGDGVVFAYTITDAMGKNVEVEEYLGAKGHSVLISPAADFIHTHAQEKEGTPVFATPLPSDPFYRIFTQFQIAGEVITVSFDWSRNGE